MNTTPITISISDPWDVGEALGWPTLRGVLLAFKHGDEGGSALVRLTQPVTFGGVQWHHLIASPRHVCDVIADIETEKGVTCNCIGISDGQAASDQPFDVSWWRGGGFTLRGRIARAFEPPG